MIQGGSTPLADQRKPERTNPGAAQKLHFKTILHTSISSQSDRGGSAMITSSRDSWDGKPQNMTPVIVDADKYEALEGVKKSGVGGNLSKNAETCTAHDQKSFLMLTSVRDAGFEPATSCV